MFGNINQILGMKSLLNGGDPNALFNQMMSTNPKFAKFVEDNKGKTVEQIAKEHNIDINMVRNLLK